MRKEVEREILKILERDGRIKEDEMGKMLGISEEEVAKIISDLTRRGIIKRYKAVIDWEKAGIDRVYAIIDLKVNPERGKGYDLISERIAKFPEVRSLYLISGDYDLQVLVCCDTMKEVAHFVSEKIAPLEQVKETNTHFLLKTYKEDDEIFYEEERERRQTVSL